MEEKECPECGATVPEDVCFEDGICEDCHEKEVEEHERDTAGLNQPIIPQRFVY